AVGVFEAVLVFGVVDAGVGVVVDAVAVTIEDRRRREADATEGPEVRRAEATHEASADGGEDLQGAVDVPGGAQQGLEGVLVGAAHLAEGGGGAGEGEVHLNGELGDVVEAKAHTGAVEELLADGEV